MTQQIKEAALEPIYVTEFPNQFGEWQLLHATRSQEKAFNDAGRTGRVLTLVERIYVYAQLEESNAKIAKLTEALKDIYDAALEADIDESHLANVIEQAYLESCSQYDEQTEEKL